MDHELYVAIFNDASNTEKSLAQAIKQLPELAGCLNSLSIFHRTSENIVEVAIVSFDERNRLSKTVLQQIDIELLVRFLPQQASWTIVATANSFQFPDTILNTRFSDYLSVMVPVGTSTIFFIPPSVAFASQFAEVMKPNSSIVLKTGMSSRDVGVLRSSLQKVR